MDTLLFEALGECGGLVDEARFPPLLREAIGGTVSRKCKVKGNPYVGPFGNMC